MLTNIKFKKRASVNTFNKTDIYLSYQQDDYNYQTKQVLT
jgi:hypothetical protein